ncbi:dipeptidyl peptidase 4-like isoform X1 [Mya arenaria]|uniref:dipeptidyl peptidase 4-like isoform X1 n=1 Tax=Mya arenaria TaxID=6604 RepID=UPI0022DF4D0F|nr:dipeptidyl peptidase 4-like isoform X1 [Mya arenaria]
MNSAAGASNVVVHGGGGKRKSNAQQPADMEELVGTTEEKRNWRGIVIALLVIVTVLALIVTAIILVTPKTEDNKEGEKVDFRGFIKGSFEPRSFQPRWLPGVDESFIFRDRNGAVMHYDCEDNSTYIIVGNNTFRELNTDRFSVSADKQYILYQYDIHKVFRHSTISRYRLVNIKTSEQYELVGPHGEQLQVVKWSTIGHSLVFVQYNDIFFSQDPVVGDLEQLTFDGFEDVETVFNGVPDWLYEEEILQSDSAMWFSPNGRHLAYATFDDRDVSSYDMSLYGDMVHEYVITARLPYPKAGTRNPTVILKVVNLITNITVHIPLPPELQNVDHYLYAVTWKDHSHVLATWMNRAQNLSVLYMCPIDGGSCKKNLRVDGEGGWVDMFHFSMFTPDASSYFLLIPHRDGAAGSFQHIAMVDSNSDIHTKPGDGSKIFLTGGRWDVVDIVGYDDVLKIIYFTATKMGDPRKRHLYSTTVSKTHESFRQVTCLSCDISEDCQFVDATFSPTGKFYILACKGPAVPSYHLYSIDNGLVITLEDNTELRKMLEDFSLPVQEYVQIPIDEDETEFMWAKVLLPPILKKDEIITYNILFKVYGAPGTQLITEEFSIGWEHYLCSTHSIIIVSVDGRGTGGRGNMWKHSVYKQLGQLEVDDTITAARYFNSLHYVNEQTAIWGMSYGGFLTASVIARGTEAFKCGLAVAPVTDWRYYDTAYTERYMGLPTARDNLAAYNAVNISKHASNFKSSRFMLIHGTADDNVHFQNSAQFMKALVEADVYFRQQIYTDENHFLDGRNTKTHFYNTMEDFVLQCYGKKFTYEDLSSDASEKDIEEEEAE